MVFAGPSEDSLRFLGKFLETFGAEAVELQIKSTKECGLFDYLNILYANPIY